MRFNKGDLLTTKYTPALGPVARVLRVTREGAVHCVNLVACSTMNEGVEFQFTLDGHTRYVLHSKR